MMRRRFGPSYDDYRASVPRFLPRAAHLESPRHIEVDVKALARECKKTLAWFLIPLAAALANVVRLHPWWPHWWMLP
jgi:hypothetical protein